jgi:hypothetical protein
MAAKCSSNPNWHQEILGMQRSFARLPEGGRKPDIL